MRFEIIYKDGSWDEAETLNAAWQAIADELSGVACAENDNAPSFAFVGEKKVAIIIDREREYAAFYPHAYEPEVSFEDMLRAYDKHIQARCA